MAGDQPIQVHIGLFPAKNDEIAYEVYSFALEGNGPHEDHPTENGAAGLVVHSQGTARLISVDRIPALNLEELQTGCTQSILSPEEVYETFQALGIDYGPAHRAINAIFVREGQVLAKLVLPASVSGTLNEFVLHPSILDSALQASMGLAINSSGSISSGGAVDPKPALPFALQELEIFGKCTSPMWALVRNSNFLPEGHPGQTGDREPARYAC